jgi:hypothetical protein
MLETQEETLKDSCTLFKNRQRLTKKSCRRQHRLKIFEIRSNLSKIVTENEELMKFFQIFERFTNYFFRRRKFRQI